MPDDTRWGEMENKYRVADINDESNLIPPGARKAAHQLAVDSGIELVWLVDESTGMVENGHAVDTINSRYFSFEVLWADGFEMLPTSDWMPCLDPNYVGGKDETC